MDLSPVDIYILLHIKKAQVEYAKMIMKMTELDLALVQSSIDKLMELGLLERDSGSAIKRTRARFKRASEVHKHHTYYRLSRAGSLFVRDIDKNYLRDYFNTLLGADGFDFILKLKQSRDFKDACTQFSGDCSKVSEKLKHYHFITPEGNKTRFFNRFISFAEL